MKFARSRIILYGLGILLYAFGIILTIKANFGILAVSTLPFVLSLITPFSFGMTTLLFTVLYIGIQKALLGKNFPRIQWLQLLVGIFFSLILDIGSYLLAEFQVVSLFGRVSVFLLGSVVIALGITLSVICEIVTPPAEGAVSAISQRLNMKFGDVKMGMDGTIVALAILLSLIFLGRLEGFQWGTIVGVFLIGFLVKALFYLLEKPITSLWRKP